MPVGALWHTSWIASYRMVGTQLRALGCRLSRGCRMSRGLRCCLQRLGARACAWPRPPLCTA